MNGLTKPIIVNLQKYCDFDIPCTAAILMAPAGMTPQTVKLVVDEVKEMAKDTDDAQEVIKYLITNWSFSTVKYYDLTIGGNL